MTYSGRPAPDTDAAQLLLDNNAKARALFFAEWPCLTSMQISEAAVHGSKNPSMATSRWKSGGKIFSVEHKGMEFFPAFQFQDGQPHETIGRVLSVLGKRKTGWQMAFWLTSPNGWLDGKRPAECLNDVDAVVGAAAEEAQTIVG
ncbi:antitoxin Xre/MbcA/ParS toxin-binding domain-containing protein [Chelativorans salis]|uniref:DUF2384 domain-containing protein n=1 Tax=Chelativorans salis TaxID=2978478 RepID=A0ABT2LMV2_9HYPH|nr:antitoxin Xre/MbcA/ParS toxin-binding domain-containing protein [Chelativorans sp. EGI FJ00035]MCT7375890.1 DUF2384 domain-containing protein [Chelativorans sp. EGI FJ00035]